jgi:hypothetical protein
VSDSRRKQFAFSYEAEEEPRADQGVVCVCVCVLVKKYAGVSVTSNLHFPLLLLLQNE